MPKDPIRVFEGNAKPHEPFWRLRNASESESEEPEIEFYGYISEYSWFEDDITPKIFKEDLNKVGKGGPVTVRMNSGGGEVFAASVIRSILVDYPGRVTMRIDGLCASAATFVATAGDTIKMQDTAFWMIHDPSAFVWGTIAEIKQILDLLKTIKSGIIDAYHLKTQADPEKLAMMMTDETWMTAKEAMEFGFIDEIIGVPNKAQAANLLAGQAVITNALLRNYRNVPAELRSLLEREPDQPTAAAEPADLAKLRAEVKLLI